MKIEVSKFGNGVLVGSGGNVVQNVHNTYADRKSGETIGVFKTEGAEFQVSISLTGEQLLRGGTDEFLVPVVLPVGAVITQVYVQTKQAFVLGGTTPTILVGTQGSEVTNGFVISAAQAQTIGTYDVTATKTGTWNAPVAAAITTGVALGGTLPTVTSVGKLEILFKYNKA
jgi:hypothetical protein